MVPPIKDIHAIKIDHINKKTVYWLLNLEILKPKSPLKANIPRYHYTIKNFGNLVKRHTK